MTKQRLTLFVLLALAFAGCTQTRPSSATPAATTGLAPTANAHGTPVATPGAPGEAMLVAPQSGRVGDRVTIRAERLSTPITSLDFVCYGRAPSGTVEAGFANVFQAPDFSSARTTFEVTWAIPAELEPVQGIGGGPTPAGDCRFETSPPVAMAPFTVIAR